MAKLARELVLAMKPRADVLSDFGLTEETAKAIEEHEFYKRVFEATCIEWNSALSVDQRLRVQSLTILEDGLTKVGARMTNADEALPGVVQLANLLTKIGGIGERTEAKPGEKFTITINLGADVQTFEKTVGEPRPIDVEVLPALEKPREDDPTPSAVP